MANGLKTECGGDALGRCVLDLQPHQYYGQTIRSELCPGTTPSSTQLDKQDNVQFDPLISGLTFSEPDQPWYAMVAGRATKQGPQDSVKFVGASGLGAGQNNEATGQLSLDLTIAAGSSV